MGPRWPGGRDNIDCRDAAKQSCSETGSNHCRAAAHLGATNCAWHYSQSVTIDRAHWDLPVSSNGCSFRQSVFAFCFCSSLSFPFLLRSLIEPTLLSPSLSSHERAHLAPLVTHLFSSLQQPQMARVSVTLLLAVSGLLLLVLLPIETNAEDTPERLTLSTAEQSRARVALRRAPHQ